MKRLLVAAFFCLSFSLCSISAQTPNATPGVRDDVVVVNTSLIQIDAVVTDKDGKQVSDLTAEDFEILQNGKEQKITNFSYVTALPARTADAESLAETRVNMPLPPVTIKLKPEQVRRTIALVVDDLGLTLSGVVNVRKALKKFVDEQMLPGDLVAIIQTGFGIGALQQFTSDKKQLYSAIERVRFNLQSRRGSSDFAPVAPNNNSQEDSENTKNQNDNKNEDSEAEINQIRDTIFTKGTLGALQYIVKGVGELPGRKAVILFSGGFALNAKNESG